MQDKKSESSEEAKHLEKEESGKQEHIRKDKKSEAIYYSCDICGERIPYIMQFLHNCQN